MKQEDALSRLRVDLSDTTKAVFDEDVLIRAVEKATSDLSRFLPLDKVSEYTLDFTITSEPWTSAAAALTYVSLANSPIKPRSEVVVNAAGTTMTRGTDYIIKYRKGKITQIDAGSIGEGESCTISYTKSEIHLNISDIYSDMIRLERVEYPLGSVPQEFISYEQFKDVLMLKPGQSDTQGQMSSGEHILVYYKGKHSTPTDIAEATYPNFLDDTVILVASAYALFTLCVKYSFQANTDFASARTALGNIAAVHLLTAAALAKVTTYVTDMDTALDASIIQTEAAVTALSSIAAIHILVDTALDKITTYVTDMDTALDAAIVQNAAAATALAKINVDETRTYLTDADAALDAFVSAIATAPTALAKMDTYLAGDTESTKALLAQIATDIAELRTGYKTAIDAAATAIGTFDPAAAVTALGLAGTALVKVTTYLENNPVGEPAVDEDSAGVLVKITTDIAGLRTAILTAQDAANEELDAGDFTDVATHLGTAAEALLKVTVYLTNNTNEDAKAWLTKITTDAAALRTAIGTALDAVATYLGNVSTKDLDAATTGAIDQLEAGDNFINTVNVGKDVPENYRSYADSMANIGGARISAALAYVQEAAGRLSNLQTYIDQASGWGSIASGFISEAIQEVAMANQISVQQNAIATQAYGYIQEASSRIDNLNSYIAQAEGWEKIASGFVAEALQRTQAGIGLLNVEGAKLEEANMYIAEANQRLNHMKGYIEQAAAYTHISDGFVAEARERINLALSYVSEASQRIAIADRYLSQASGHAASANGYVQEANSRRAMTQAFVDEANARMREIELYLSEASNRVTYANAYIAEANGRRAMTQAFIDEANSRTYEMDRYIEEATRYTTIANQNLELVDRFRLEAIERRNEGWTIWRSPNQYASLQSTSNLRQPIQ